MYSDSDLEAAVTAGALSEDAASSFRAFVAKRQQAPAVDEERFRLLTGFNDIFVTIAAVLILIAIGWICHGVSLFLAGAAVAAASWGLAEYFTRQRRMALPSIVLLLGFVGSVFVMVLGAFSAFGIDAKHGGPAGSAVAMVSLAVAALAAYAHWRRFMVPITVAAGTCVALGAVIALLLAIAPGLQSAQRFLFLIGGIGVFGLAMWWDASDRARVTRRTDVAFWLHLAAAPLIVHPVFGALGLLGHSGAHAGDAVIAIFLYSVLAIVALAVDRRAILVSALAYVLIAMTAILKAAGSVGLGFAVAALVIGCCLLLLSAFWHDVRRRVVREFPVGLQALLPAA
jgi:hypothetical protein